ncbi:phosphatase PAP2 family protein [Mycobacterium sp. D16Q16]|uniref:phosphatase PAP2 family protein n=1 Tax=Mycobacterium sp. D16Q16 TaxID=1855659 RepID=UPI00099344FD|nr:phosphatase PAP2 family protein [Mycobacterium sp. D16Q16]
MTFSLRNLRPETTSARTAAVLAAALFVVFATLAATAHHYGSGSRVDHRALDWLVIHRHSWLTSAAVDITDIGSPATVSVVTVIAALAIWQFARSLRTATTVVAAVASAFFLAAAAKWAVGEHRPPRSTQLVAETGWSFPSGHVTGTTALAGMLAIVVAYRHSGWRRLAALVAAIVAVTLVAGSRLYLGDHWVVDVLAAVVLSTLVVTIAAATLHETPTTGLSRKTAA